MMEFKNLSSRVKGGCHDLLHSIRHPRPHRAFTTDAEALHKELQEALGVATPPNVRSGELAANLLDEKLQNITGVRSRCCPKASLKSRLMTKRRRGSQSRHGVTRKRTKRAGNSRFKCAYRHTRSYASVYVLWYLRRAATHVRRAWRRCRHGDAQLSGEPGGIWAKGESTWAT